MSIICWTQVSLCLVLWQEVVWDSGMDNEGTKNEKCGAIEDRKKQRNHSPDAREVHRHGAKERREKPFHLSTYLV